MLSSLYRSIWLRQIPIVVLCVYLASSTSSLAGAEERPASCRKETAHKIVSQIQTWQTEYLSSSDPSLQSRPFVLASFAQSLDGKIAPWKDDDPETNDDGAARDETTTASNYPLSGPESLVVTHAIRSIHDGILVGGRTLSIDNPQLTNRLWMNVDDDEDDDHDAGQRRRQPIPVVVDTSLHHVLAVGSARRARNLVVCCHEASPLLDSPLTLPESLSSSLSLLPCKLKGSQIDMLDLLQKLRSEHAIRTLMVEGGAAVLTSLFQQGLVDAVCITIAPKALCGGIAPCFGSRSPIDLGHLSAVFVPLGSDCILLSRWPDTRKEIRD